MIFLIMSIATVDNQLIHYEVLGRGQPLIFVHGWLGSWRYWWPSMQALSTGKRAFAIDLWGFGDSSKAPHLYTLSTYVDMIGQFIDKMGIVQPVILVGHSLGAAVALRFAQSHPENVQKVVAVSLPVQGEFINARLLNTAPDAFLTRVLGKANNFAEVDAEIRKSDQLAVNQMAQELSGLDFTEELAACPRPLLLVAGGQDQVVQLPPGEHGRLQNPDQNCFAVTLEECNHFPMLQEAVKFNRLLLDFIHADDSVTELTPKEYWQRRVR